MRTFLIFSLFFLLPASCGASSDDPCYPDQHPFNVEECDVITEISWDNENSVSEIPATGSGTVYVLNGKPGFTYEVSGTNFYLDAAGTITKEEKVTERHHPIYTVNACGTGEVTVTDSCGNQASDFISTDLALKWDETSLIEEMAANDTHQLKLTGMPPFTFTVEGNGFYFDAAGTLKTITTSSQSVMLHTIDACGPANVTVRDSCNDIISLEVRSVSGRWVKVGFFSPINLRETGPHPYLDPRSLGMWHIGQTVAYKMTIPGYGTRFNGKYALQREPFNPQTYYDFQFYTGNSWGWAYYDDSLVNAPETFFQDPVTGRFTIRAFGGTQQRGPTYHKYYCATGALAVWEWVCNE